MLDLQDFTTEDLRLMFHACRKYQKSLISAPYDYPEYWAEYHQLSQILTKLQPVAYPDAFEER